MKPSLEVTIKSQIPGFDFEVTDDFVGIFDNAFSPEFCKKWIDHFDKVDSAGLSYSRVQAFDRPSHLTKDQAIDFDNYNFAAVEGLEVQCAEFNHRFWGMCYPLYAEKYSILQTSDPHSIFCIKLQKTVPGGGYHAWHYESMSRRTSSRVMTFVLYLNDIEDGGETEFLYLSERVQPKAGRLILWPASFTHTHRGNPPLKGNKYIMTGWVEF
jgi:hypothetical protein